MAIVLYCVQVCEEAFKQGFSLYMYAVLTHMTIKNVELRYMVLLENVNYCVK